MLGSLEVDGTMVRHDHRITQQKLTINSLLILHLGDEHNIVTDDERKDN